MSKSYQPVFTIPEGAVIRCCCSSIAVNIEKKPIEPRVYVFSSDVPFQTYEYLFIEYSMFGLQRDHELHAPFILGIKDGVETPLCEINDVVCDRRRHRLVVKTEPETYDSLKLRFLVRAPKVELNIYSITFCSKTELPIRFSEYFDMTTLYGFEALDLQPLYNASVNNEPARVDDGISLPKGLVSLKGVPFLFSSSDTNRIAPPPSPKENDDIICNFGIPTKRIKCRPISRDSEIVVPINDTAKEIVFAVSVTGNTYERYAFCAKDPSILGNGVGEVMMPMHAVDVERFRVDIEYDNGDLDTAFPYNLGYSSHFLGGATGIYVVPASNRKIKSVFFRNRIFDVDVSILAVTLNKTGYNLIPPKPGKISIPRCIPEKNKMTLHGSILCIDNHALHMIVDIGKGLKILHFANDYTPMLTLSGSLLKLRIQENLIEEFILADVVCSNDDAVLKYTYNNLCIRVTIALAESSKISLSLTAENTSDSEIACGILFPVLDKVCFADWRDTWYMFPKYQNTISNGHIYVYEESAPSFPMQFFDIFSPSQDGGIAVQTFERELNVRKYAIAKDDTAVSAFVEYPDMYVKIAPKSVYTATDTVIYVHPGDWRFAFEQYRTWLKTWYVPYKAQNKEWYRRCFWLIAEITDFFETDDFTKLPIWYDKETKTYNYDRIMKEQTEIYGCSPDILHMWKWAHSPEVGHGLWGYYGKEDYDRMGGLDNMMNALHKVSDETGAYISLYLHPTLLSKYYSFSNEFMPELMVRTKSGGTVGLYNDTFRMCHANKRWRDYVLQMYDRVYKETGIKILYVDEFSLRINNRCWADNHGHAVPSNLLQTDRDFISTLREQMPEEVVLYGEYAAVDVNARYIDCNITYHILDSVRDMIETAWTAQDGDDNYGRVFTDLYRFAFPGIVQLVLPMAMRFLSWQPLKSTFFNGEAIYDSFWDAEESRGREFMAKSFKIKKEYGDCFASNEPETMISSPLDGVFMNRYPGNHRTLYTIYNSAFTTKRGVLASFPYDKDTTYFDIWNNTECTVNVHDDMVDVIGCIGAQEIGCIVADKH